MEFQIINKQIIGRDIKRLDVRAEAIAHKVLPGQFVMVAPEENSKWIPLSVAETDLRRGLISLIFQEKGHTTQVLGKLGIHEKLFSVTGPFGRAPEIRQLGVVVCLATGVGAAQILPMAKAYKKAVLLPLMVVAGDHAQNDLAGDGEDSWKSNFVRAGFEVECVLKGLGEYIKIRDIYVKHVWDAVNASAPGDKGGKKSMSKQNGGEYWRNKNYSFFQHRECESFPCHKTDNIENFNCLFCYCPLYTLGEDCGGNFVYTQSGIKNCVNCDIPHKRENYGLIIGKYPLIAKLAAKKQEEEKKL